MREFSNFPRDNGSRRSRCPPSHHEMALTPYYAQASARAPRPSPPSTHSPVLPGKVSPHHQQGSTTPSAAPAASPSRHLVSFASMGGGSPHTRPHDRSYGSMAPSPATTAATKPSPSSAPPSLPTRSSPTHPLPTMGGSAASAARRALSRGMQRLAFAMSTRPKFADKPWVMEAVNAVARELQFWYRRHSIRRYLARQTRRRLAATTLQCWKRRIWLSRWFAQQAQLRQKRHRLRLLCRGASAYARSVRGDRQPPPTPTEKSSDPKVFNHPFRSRGQPLPPRKMRRRHKRPRRRPGRRHRPRAPDSGGGPLCMPLCFWATQTVVAASVLFVGATRSKFIPYLPPHTAATIIQRAYRSHCVDEWESRSRLSCAQQDQVVLPMPKGDLSRLELDQIKEIQASTRKLLDELMLELGIYSSGRCSLDNG